MDISFLKKNICLTSSYDIDTICKPLKKHFDINVFNYFKRYKDGSRFQLCNNANWTEYFFEKEYYRTGPFESTISEYQYEYALCSTLVREEQIFIDASINFNIGHGIIIIDKQLEDGNFYYFGTSRNNYQLLNFYLSNIDLLKRFIRYFNHMAAPIIKQAAAQKFVLPFSDSIKTSNNVNIDTGCINAFMSETEIPHHYLSMNKNIVLTPREKDCAKYLLAYKKTKEIAKALNLSPRTIEKYLSNMKNKTGSHTLTQLIAYLLKSGLNIRN